MSFAGLTKSIRRGLLSLAGGILRSLLSCRSTESARSSLLSSASVLSIRLRLLTIGPIDVVGIGISLTIGGIV